MGGAFIVFVEGMPFLDIRQGGGYFLGAFQGNEPKEGVFISYRTIRNEPKKRAGASPLDPSAHHSLEEWCENEVHLNKTREGNYSALALLSFSWFCPYRKK